jgi:hypothetical protein
MLNRYPNGYPIPSPRDFETRIGVLGGRSRVCQVCNVSRSYLSMICAGKRVPVFTLAYLIMSTDLENIERGIVESLNV